MMILVFTTFNIVYLLNNFFFFCITIADWIVLVIFTLVLTIFDGNKNKIILRIKRMCPELKVVLLCSTIILILVFGIYGIGFDVNEFIYSNF